MRATLLRHNQSPMWTEQLQRVWRRVRKGSAAPLAPPDTYDDAEIAAMLRELGMALVEVVQPTQLVRTRLLIIAARYTSKVVRIVVLPTVLLIQVGTEHYEVDTSTRATTQLDLAGRVDQIAWLAVRRRHHTNRCTGSP